MVHVAMATAPGFKHVNPGQPGKTNNQDAIASQTYERGQVIVLCDGCSDQPYSGTGADIGAHLIANLLAQKLGQQTISELSWEEITQEIVDELRETVDQFTRRCSPQAKRQVLIERFLFTAMVVIVDGDQAVVAAIGDGLLIVDDDEIILQPPILSSPAYLGYLLIEDTPYHTEKFRGHLKFSVLREVHLPSLSQGLIVGTDGLKGLTDEEDLQHPALVQPKSLQRWLNAKTAETIKNGQLLPGRCSDDVSLAIIRHETTQTAAVEKHRETVELKRKVLRLTKEVGDLTSEWERTDVAKTVAEKEVRDLEAKVAQLEGKAERLATQEAEVDKLKSKVSDLRKKLPRQARPLLVIVEEFLDRLVRRPAKPTFQQRAPIIGSTRSSFYDESQSPTIIPVRGIEDYGKD